MIQVAVEATRAGADDVKVKPCTPQTVLSWVEQGVWTDADPRSTPSLERMEWEYVRRVVSDCGHNQSEAARRLKIERLTLRRQLRKRAPAR